MSAKTNPDPSIAVTPQPNVKRCQVCRAILPVASFGTSRSKADGRNPICKECRSQANRNNFKAKYNSKPRKEDFILRSLNGHNRSVLFHMLNNPPQTNRYKIYGYSVEGFEIISGAFTIYPTQFHLSVPGSFEVYTNRDVDAFIQMAVDGLSYRSIRLELSPAHVTFSARELYGKTL